MSNLTNRQSLTLLALTVPLARFTSRVGGGCNEFAMKWFLKIAGIVAVTHLMCFWTSYLLLRAQWSHISLFQFFGFVPTPPPSHFEAFVQWAFIVLGVPASILLDGVNSAYLLPAIILVSILNSIVWGVCLALPIYGVCKRFRFHHVGT